MRRETVLDHLHATQKRAQIRERDVKAMRHTAASFMIAAGKPDIEVAYALGHRDSQVTRTVYAHWFRRAKSEGAGALAREILRPRPEEQAEAVSEADGDFLETSEREARMFH